MSMSVTSFEKETDQIFHFSNLTIKQVFSSSSSNIRNTQKHQK